MAAEFRPHHREHAPAVIGPALAGEALHQRERDDGGGDAELDRLARGPAPLAGVGDGRRDVRQVRILREESYNFV